MKDLNSPYLIKLFGATLQPLCMVMEYCEKGCLYDILKQTKEHTWSRNLSYMKDMAEGITALHELNIVHRDLKSLNLLVTKDWRIKVCDFGLSRHVKTSNMETFTKVRGTVAYCAPEVFSGQGICTTKSDIYSMGIVIWELLFTSMNNNYSEPFSEFGSFLDFQLLVQTTSGLRPNIPPKSPAPIVEIYLACIHSDPDSRPDSLAVSSRINELWGIFEEDKDRFLNDIYDGDIVFAVKDINPVQSNRSTHKPIVINDKTKKFIKSNDKNGKKLKEKKNGEEIN